VKEAQKAAKAKKEEGNGLYKLKKFDEALNAYDEAARLDPTNMTFLSNKAAVYFSQKRWQDCADECLRAVQVGKENRAPFEDRAKAYTRAARAYQKLGDYGRAIEMCNEAQLESYDKDTQRLLKTLELEKKKADSLAYQSDEKAEEAKQRGNEFFRAQKWSDAVNEYEEAVKRAPKNAAIRNNLAAALCKILDFSGAQRQVEVALEIDPAYVKAWARLGDIQMMFKEYHKAMESYKKGLAIDPENAMCREGLKKCAAAINFGRQNMTEDEKREQHAHALADPEIQNILQDPVIQQILRDFSENPTSAQQALKDPGVRGKIEKLIAAGIIETR
jgi:stress-induced-phosphoprotein 1